MNAVVVSKIKTSQCSKGSSPVPNRTATRTDLFGVPIRKNSSRKARLGDLSKKELIAEVRKIFPNATVLPNR